jgi:hypothetical protein
MTYEEFIALPDSEKVILAHVEPGQRVFLFTLDSGSTYIKSPNYFVTGVTVNGTALTSVSTSSLNSGEFYYSPQDNKLYVRLSDDSDPGNAEVFLTYRLFFANGGYNLPYDLASGEYVHYEERLTSNSRVTKSLDSENIGTALESSTSLSFVNSDGYFDDIFDTLFFESKRAVVYSWHPDIAITEAQKVFEGIIQNKSFSYTDVKFKCKDEIFKLREPVNTGLFSASDGNLQATAIGKPKRRLYGEFDKADMTPIDNILEGYDLTGTITGLSGSDVVTGSGTAFFDECSPNDELLYTIDGVEYSFNVQSVDSDTQITLDSNIDISITAGTAKLKPQRSWRKKNRRWHLAGHKLRAPSTTVTSAFNSSRFTVADSTDFEADALINVGAEEVFVKRIVGNEIVLKTTLNQGTPSNGTAVTRSPINQLYIKSERAFIDRDYTITNASECIVEIEELAEFNIAKQRSMAGSFTFTNGSKTVTVTGNDPRNEIQVRDWIKSDDVTHAVWYEVLEVTPTSVIVRVDYAGANNTGSGFRKNVDLLEDSSYVLADCLGLEENDTWIKTGAQVVKHLIDEVGITNIDTASFTNSQNEAPYKMSLPVPVRKLSRVPKVRDTITKVNESVFGSLSNNQDWNLRYDIVDSRKPQELVEVKDDDIFGRPLIQTKNNIVKTVKAEYRPFVDRFTGDDSFTVITHENELAGTATGATAEKEVEVYLFDQVEAKYITQFYGLTNSISQNIVTVNTNLKYILSNLNDKFYVNFRRLFKRFGGNDRKKIGIINKISHDGKSASISFNDLGNIFNRVANYADASDNEFTSASESEKLFNGYYVEETKHVPDVTSEKELGQNIYG